MDARLQVSGFGPPDMTTGIATGGLLVDPASPGGIGVGVEFLGVLEDCNKNYWFTLRLVDGEGCPVDDLDDELLWEAELPMPPRCDPGGRTFYRRFPLFFCGRALDPGQFYWWELVVESDPPARATATFFTVPAAGEAGPLARRRS
jgi:hypothetical protein